MGNNSSFKQKTISGMIWSALEKIGTLGISFVSNIVLARLLLPSDYGSLGMIKIFTSVSSALVIGGFGAALIQKKETTETDYNSVFWWNIGMSIILYAILFCCAPAIASFYHLPELCLLLRITSLHIIIVAFSTVQTNILTREMNFSIIAKRNIISSIVGTAVAIALAFGGCGVWSLVANSLISGIVGVALLWNMSSWRPSFEFSFKSIKGLFEFGGVLMISSIINKVSSEIQGLIIGKKYTGTDLGYYNQAHSLEALPTESLTHVVNQVSYPLFSKFQSDLVELKHVFKKNLTSLIFLNTGLIVLLIVAGQPLIHFLYGEKWMDSVPYFKVLCLSGFFLPYINLNASVVKALGRSKLYFNFHIIIRTFGIILMFIGVKFGVHGIIWSMVLTSFVMSVTLSCINGKLIEYGCLKQLKDSLLYILSALLSGAISYSIVKYVNCGDLGVLMLCGVSFTICYLILAELFKLDGYLTYKTIILTKFKFIQ